MRAEGEAQVVEHLPHRWEAEFKLQYTPQKKVAFIFR
jgi:hypothetical protein